MKEVNKIRIMWSKLHCPFSEVILYWLGFVGGGGGGWCPLFGVERCPLLGGSKCISVMVKSTGASEVSTVQRLSAFWREVLLYFLMEAA